MNPDLRAERIERLTQSEFGVGGSNGSPDVLDLNGSTARDGRAVRRDNRPLGPAARRAGRPLGGCLWPIGRSAAAPIA